MGQYTLIEGNEAVNRARLMMGYDSKKTLIENIGDTDVVFTDWLSPDENYVIFLDELYDLENKKNLGNIWENFDTFKIFLKHSFEVTTTLPKQLQESTLETINTLVLSESKQDIRHLKPIVKEMIKEGIFGDIGDWIKEKGTSAINGVKNFVSKAYEGGKQLVSAISDGDWSKILQIIGKGILFLARQIRGAMYHPIGMILDGILIATGIGKTVQWIPWAIIVALDLYEVATGDYEDKESPVWLRAIMIGVDCLGLVLAGAASKAAKAAIEAGLGGAKTLEQGAAAVAKNPALKGVLSKISGALETVPGKMTEAVSFLSKKFPSGAQFIQKYIGGLGRLIGRISESLSGLLKGTASKVANVGGKVGNVAKIAGKETLKTGTLVGGTEYGVKKGLQLYQGAKQTELVNTIKNTNVKPDFAGGF